MDPEEMVDVAKTMNTPEDTIPETVGMSKEEENELRDEMLDYWKEYRYVDYFDEIGVAAKDVHEELQDIALAGNTDETPTHLAGRLLLSNGVDEIEVKHYAFFSRIMKLLANKSIERGKAVTGQVAELDEEGLLSTIINNAKEALKRG